MSASSPQSSFTQHYLRYCIKLSFAWSKDLFLVRGNVMALGDGYRKRGSRRVSEAIAVVVLLPEE